MKLKHYLEEKTNQMNYKQHNCTDSRPCDTLTPEMRSYPDGTNMAELIWDGQWYHQCRYCPNCGQPMNTEQEGADQ